MADTTRKTSSASVPDELTCPGCQKLYVKPSLLFACRHTLCKACCDAQTDAAHVRCSVCGELTDARDVRTAYKIQKQLDLYCKKIREQHSDKIKSLAQDMLSYKKSLAKSVVEFEYSGHSLRHCEYAMLKQIDISERDVVLAAQEKHDYLRQEVLRRIDAKRRVFDANKLIFNEHQTEATEMYDILRKLARNSNDTQDIDVNETLENATSFLLNESQKQLQIIQESKPRLDFDFVPVADRAARTFRQTANCTG